MLAKHDIIALNGGKSGKKDEGAKLTIDGEEYDLESFVLSGEGPDGKRLLFSWNCSLDEMISYVKVLEVSVIKRVSDAMMD